MRLICTDPVITRERKGDKAALRTFSFFLIRCSLYIGVGASGTSAFDARADADGSHAKRSAARPDQCHCAHAHRRACVHSAHSGLRSSDECMDTCATHASTPVTPARRAGEPSSPFQSAYGSGAVGKTRQSTVSARERSLQPLSFDGTLCARRGPGARKRLSAGSGPTAAIHRQQSDSSSTTAASPFMQGETT